MATERRFKTEILSDEDVSERRENAISKPIDYLDVDGLKNSIALWTRIKETAEKDPENINFQITEAAQRNIESSRDYNYDRFLDATEYLPDQGLSIFLSAFKESKHLYLIERMKVLENEEGDISFVTLEKFWDDIKDSLRNRTMPIEAWTGLLTEYKEILKRCNDKLQEVTPQIKTRVKKQFITHINSDLEVPKSEEEIDEILNAYNFRIIDPLAAVSHTGSHSGSQGLIYLGLYELIGEEDGLESKQSQHLVAHEMLHALSAGQVLKHSLEKVDDDGFVSRNGKVTNQWSGLSTGGFNIDRFIWLNEAVTETLSAKMVEGKPTSYSKEIELMNLLLAKGKKTIDFKLLVNAYFEKKGYEAEDDVDDEHKFWRKLRQEIRDSYDHDPQFLIRLDDAIKENGIAAVIDFMKKWDPNNPPEKIEVSESNKKIDVREEIERVKSELDGLDNVD